MSSSPWGTIDHVTKIVAGVSFVSTPGHGGIRVAEGKARLMSEAARKKAIRQGSYYFFEEDCDYAIALIEIPEALDAEAVRLKRSSEEVRAEVLRSLNSWNVSYCLERGLPVTEEALKQHRAREREAQRRRERDPDLVVAAVNDGDGVVKVWTADNCTHRVTAASYDAKQKRGELNLHEMVLVKVAGLRVITTVAEALEVLADANAEQASIDAALALLA
jgi:hypothetical protein